MASIIVLVAVFIIFRMFKVISAREVGIKERFGKYVKTLNPGFHFMIPFVDRIAYKHEMREQVLDVPAQSCITKDNVQVEVDGIIFLKVMDPYKASYGIERYHNASINLAQTTMRSEVGKLDLDETFKERDEMNEKIVSEIDKASDPWGIKFIRYEIRNIEPSGNMVDTMERQMEAERHKRAEITLSEGEKESRTIISDGEKIEAINISQGEKTKRINEAQGRAKEIEIISDATAKGIQLMAKAIKKPGGNLAVQMRIIDQFIEQFGKIMQSGNVKIVPSDLANMKGFFEGVSKVGSTVRGKKG